MAKPAKPAKPPEPAGKKRRRGKRTPKTPKAKPLWADTRSLIVRAMVLSGDRLAVAGATDVGKKDAKMLAFQNEAEARAGFEGSKGIYLRIVRAADGKKVSETRLPDMPVFDGMSAAGGRLYLSLRNGSVVCFEKR